MNRLGLFMLFGVFPAVAHAHSGHGVEGIGNGILHPLVGLDHLVAMVAVGVWAAQLGGRSVWAVPVAFLGAMAVGGLLGAGGFPLPLVEPGIVGSVVLLGVLVMLAVSMPVWAGMAVVGGFALFHGFAHGAEMPGGAGGVGYGIGFLLATGVLHAAGIAGGIALKQLAWAPALRLVGALILVIGLTFAF
jgi:urease accessory protein